MLGVSHVVIQFPLYEQAKLAMARHRKTTVNELGLMVRGGEAFFVESLLIMEQGRGYIRRCSQSYLPYLTLVRRHKENPLNETSQRMPPLPTTGHSRRLRPLQGRRVHDHLPA